MKPRLPKHRTFITLVSAFSLVGYLQATPAIPAAWTNTSRGTLDGDAFVCGGFGLEQISTSDLRGSDYLYAPLASDQSVISYASGSGASNAIYFGSIVDGNLVYGDVIEGILLYAVGWNGGPLNGNPATYTLSSAFQVMSGFGNATVQGNTITVPDGQYASGILRLRGQVSGFSIADSEPTDGSRNCMTFAKSTIRFDADADGIEDEYETGTGVFVSPENTGTSPAKSDSDGDGLRDGQEVLIYHTNPNLPDTDGDGFLDPYEILCGRSPTDANDKPALVAEARTAIEFTFPSVLGKTYRIEDSVDLTTWKVVESGIAGNGSVIQRFYSTRGMPKRYFRVEEDAP